MENKASTTTDKSPLIASFKKRKAELSALREEEEKITSLKRQAQKEKAELALTSVQQERTHRELFDQELRNAIALAAEKRVEASYRDLIVGVDIMKKHMNIIDGVSDQNQERIIVIPGALFQRDAQCVEGELIMQEISNSVSSPSPSSPHEEDTAPLDYSSSLPKKKRGRPRITPVDIKQEQCK